ncbi:MAG: RDD family protein [Bacteroidales bacterium]|nr:RDD family protein [Bacteroidales bacterium]
MHKTNDHSLLFSEKNTDELIKIAENFLSSTAQKLAAIWELERRNELPENLAHLEQIIQSTTNELEILHSSSKKKLKTDENSYPYDTFWLRVFAKMIDSSILYLILFLLNKWFLKNIDFQIVNIISIIILYSYSILFNGLKGQTPGKMIMRIKIYKSKNESKIINIKQAIIRDLAPLILNITVVIVIIWIDKRIITAVNGKNTLSFASIMIWAVWSFLNIFCVLATKKHKAIHDLIAGSVVKRR